MPLFTRAEDMATDRYRQVRPIHESHVDRRSFHLASPFHKSLLLPVLPTNDVASKQISLERKELPTTARIRDSMGTLDPSINFESWRQLFHICFRYSTSNSFGRESGNHYYINLPSA